MNEKVSKALDATNGWMVLLRFVLPIMMGFMMFLLTDIKDDVCELRNYYHSLNDNLHHEVTEVKERLSSLEALLKGK